MDLLNTDAPVFDIGHYDPDEMIQLLNEFPNPLANAQDFIKHCIKNPSFYHSSYEIVSIFNRFVLSQFQKFPDFGEAIKTIALLSELSDEPCHPLIWVLFQ